MTRNPDGMTHASRLKFTTDSRVSQNHHRKLRKIISFVITLNRDHNVLQHLNSRGASIIRGFAAEKERKRLLKTHGERFLPAGSHDGGSDDANVELVLLLLHHVLGQGFGVGVGVGPVADEPRRDVPHDAVVHPPGGGARARSEE